MNYYCGTDIIEVGRIKKAMVKENFLNRLLLPSEIDYVKKFKNTEAHVAGFFSAKEAVMKALIDCKEIAFKDIEIFHDEHGAPFVKLYGKAKSVYETLNATDIQISISQTENYATAVCVIV